MKIPSITFNDRLLAASNRPTGFDYMRLILAILVVCSHTINVCYGKLYTQEIWNSALRPLLAFILPMFFALSGFLVAGSLERSKSIISFSGLRLIRLVPAIAVDTAIGALLLGPLFTTLPLNDYLSNPEFHRYFLNIVGDIHYTLPGVFVDNPWPKSINQQLWTLPFELICYVSLIAMSFLGITQRRNIFMYVIVFFNFSILVYFVFFKHALREDVVPGPLLIQSFWYGILMYFFRTKLQWNQSFFLVALAATIVLLSVPRGDFLLPLPITYVTVYLGLLQPRRTWLITKGDYSYGIFLYGFPVQQAVVAVLGKIGHSWYVNLLIALPLTIILAAFSWWCVEKPAMKLRKGLFATERFLLEVANRIPGGRFFIPTLDNRVSTQKN